MSVCVSESVCVRVCVRVCECECVWGGVRYGAHTCHMREKKQAQNH